MAFSGNTETPAIDTSAMSFDHVQCYVRSLESLEFYKDLESKNNAFRADLQKNPNASTAHLDANYRSYNQDLAKQMIWGFGYRITAYNDSPSSRSFLVSAGQNNEVSSRYVITAPKPDFGEIEGDYNHFFGSAANEFFKLHNDREGFAVFGFTMRDVGAVDKIYQNCLQKHPKLLAPTYANGPKVYNEDGVTFKVVELYTFYKGSSDAHDEPDLGTRMRFSERVGANALKMSLPGFQYMTADFPIGVHQTYFDHWVSNVFNRKQYLDTLKDLVGFIPKVDFNAGVVAAGGIICLINYLKSERKNRLIKFARFFFF